MKQNKGFLVTLLIAGIFFVLNSLFAVSRGGTLLDWLSLLVGVFMAGTAIYKMKNPVKSSSAKNPITKFLVVFFIAIAVGCIIYAFINLMH